MTFSPITVEPRPLNSRLWFLEGKRLAGTATVFELIELESICNSIEGGQDNLPLLEGLV